MIINELINNNNKLIILNKFMWNVIEYMLIRRRLNKFALHFD